MKKAIFVLPLLLLLAGLAYWMVPGMFGAGPRVIALVHLTSTDALTGDGFREGMTAQGWREGKEVVYLAQGPAGHVDKLDALISGYLAQKPDLIMVSSTPATRAVLKLTEGSQIPVLFAPVNDPVAAGFLSDVKRPGGHVSGVRLSAGGDDLRLKWFKELAPTMRRVYVPYTPGDKSAETSLASIRGVASQLDIELVEQPLGSKDKIEEALAGLASKQIDAIFLPRDIRIEGEIDAFVAHAYAQRMPLCGPGYAQVSKGALMSFGFMHQLIGRQASRMAVQVLGGEPVGNIPVETAESMLALNLVTAERIGLNVPDQVLRQAEMVIRK